MGSPPGGLGGVRRGFEPHPVVWEGLGGVSKPIRRSGRGQEGSRSPLGGPGRVGRPIRRPGRGWEAHPAVRERLGGLTGGSGGVGIPTRRSGRVERYTLMSRWGQEAYAEVSRVREAQQGFRDGSGGSPGCPGGVGRPTRRSSRDWEAIPKVRERSGGPFVTRDWLGVHPGGLG